MIALLEDVALATQFLTRVPVPFKSLNPARLSRASAWFPVVGLLVGGAAALCYHLLTPHLGRMLASLATLLLMILMTGGLHEDGLADCADAFGGGWTREDRLRILKDSRIGSFGAIALIVSLGARVLLLGTIPIPAMFSYLIAAQVLARWTPLPLSAMLSSARGHEGQGGRVAGRISWSTVVFGTVLAIVPVACLLRLSILQPMIAVLAIVAISGFYYRQRLGGITGDCLGATIQISEIAVCLCGAWVR